MTRTTLIRVLCSLIALNSVVIAFVSSRNLHLLSMTVMIVAAIVIAVLWGRSETRTS